MPNSAQFLSSVCISLINIFFYCLSKWSLVSVQAPVFISFFIALRKMAYLPVPSFQTGGLLWFPDLTAADPFYILPLAVTGTMFFILEVRDFSPKQWTDFSLWQTVICIHVFSECLPLFSWVQSLVLTIPTCGLWRLCSGSCLLSSSLSRSTSPRSVSCSFSSLSLSAPHNMLKRIN